ncbi:MAG: twin-arginine translocase subunit TatC [SAR324 cluster bacterium]|nr:twin-arginine translocase subunit TatC [SAR324 cluster bacterium]MDP6294670.1 twin-arginine translocase subunit TatC [SAR324 cluster bacterium]
MSKQNPEKKEKSKREEHTDDVPMPLTSHLGELRKRLVHTLIVIIAVFVAATSIEMELDQPILSAFRAPLDARNIPLVFLELTEPFFTYLRIGLYAALFLSFPYLLGQIWLFVRPALFSKERNAIWPFILFSYPLFVGGGLFGYFVVIPYGYDFFLGFENKFTLPSLSMASYLSLTIHLLFAFGLIFELPTVSFILTRLGIINAAWLRENRKYSLVVIFITAAVLTPPDVFTQTLMAGPLIILYEISILVSKMAERKKEEAASETANVKDAKSKS